MSQPVEPTTLEEAYGMAQRARASGNTYIRINVRPLRRFAQFNVIVWDGVIGRVRGRTCREDFTPGGEPFLVVDCLQVEVSAVSVIEAFTRSRMVEEKEKREGSKLMQINRIRFSGRANTRR